MEKKDIWGWSALWIVLVIAVIMVRPILPVDETRYLSVAWEMWQSGNFLVPHINGLAYSDKPPLLFWLIDFGWWLFGVNQWSARLTAPLFGLGAIFLASHLAGALFPEKNEVRRTTPFFLIGMMTWTIYATFTMFDTLLTCTTLLALIVIYRGATLRFAFCWLLLGIIIAMGVLSKGPIILIYVLPCALLAPWWAEQLPVSYWRWYCGIFIALGTGTLLALAWALPAAEMGGEAYKQSLLFKQTANRMVHSFAHGRPFYWYLSLLPVLLFPWSCWLPPLKGMFRVGFSSKIKFLVSIFLPGITLLSMISGKQVHYLLPLLPILAIFLARANADRPREKTLHSIVFIALYGLISILICILPFLPLKGGDAWIVEQLPAWTALGPTLALLVFMVNRRQTGLFTIRKITVSIVVLIISLHIAASGPAHQNLSFSGIAEAIKNLEDQQKKIGVFPPSLRDQLQFSARLKRPVVPLMDPGELFKWARRAPNQYSLVHMEDPVNHTLPPLPPDSVAIPYKHGWLLLLRANMFSGNGEASRKILEWFFPKRS